MERDDYKKRFYDTYISSQWQYIEHISPQSVKAVARVLEKHIVPFLPSDKDASILDVACGPGHLLRFLQQKGYHNSMGIDLGLEQLGVARKLGVKNIEHADLFEYLKKYKSEFDIIIILATIEHLTKEEAVQALDLIYDALKPGGRIIISTSNAMSIFDLECTFGDFTHELVFTPRSLAQILRVCKFSNIQIHGIKPVIYDVGSGLRAMLWALLSASLAIVGLITHGIGRSIWKYNLIFEPMILGIGQK